MPGDNSSTPNKGGKIAGGIGAAILAAVALAGPITRGFEGDVRHPNKDPIGKWEVCYGETAVPLRDYSEAECRAFMAARQKNDFAPIVLRAVPAFGSGKYPDPFAASIDFTYNVGQFGKTSMARDFRAGRLVAACDDFLKYRFAHQGKPPHDVVAELPGLASRRKCERVMCLGDQVSVTKLCPKGVHI